MDVEDATAAVNQLVHELDDWIAKAEEANRRVTGIRTILAGYVQMFPALEAQVGPLATHGTNEPPRGAEAVRLVLQSDSGTPWTVSELVEALNERGWLPDSDNPANAVRAALNRLMDQDGSDVHKRRRGQYVSYVYDPDIEEEEPPPF